MKIAKPEGEGLYLKYLQIPPLLLHADFHGVVPAAHSLPRKTKITSQNVNTSTKLWKLIRNKSIFRLLITYIVYSKAFLLKQNQSNQ